MTTFMYKLIWAFWQNYLDDSINRSYDFIACFSRYLVLRRPRVANFADIKIVIMIWTSFKDSKKVKRIGKNVLKCNFFVFPDVTKSGNFRWINADVSRTQGVYHVIYIFFGSSSGKVWLCQVLSLWDMCNRL